MNEKRLIQVMMLPAASVVIAEDDYRELERLHQENEQLRGNLSLAEEGLANYEEEVQAWIKIKAQKDAEIERLRALLTQAPIAKVTVRESFGGDVLDWVMCAPGLPPGEHDLYLMPSVPQSEKQT